MANAIPLSLEPKRRKAPVIKKPEEIPADDLAHFPEHHRAAARQALADGKRVELTYKGFLRIYAADPAE